MREPGTHELGLFAATVCRTQPRDRNGRFVRARYDQHRLKALEVAREMRARLGLPPSPYLTPFEPCAAAATKMNGNTDDN